MKEQAAKQKKVQPPQQEALPAFDKAVQRQIAVAAGTEYFSRRDPIYHVSESFTRVFDMMGAQRAGLGGRQRQNEMFQTFMQGTLPNGQQQSGAGEGTSMNPVRDDVAAEGRFLEQTSMESMFESSPGRQDSLFSHKFAQTAFQRGTLAAAVCNGTGQMMLFSCLKRTVGQSQPVNFRQRKLFESGSVSRNVAGSPPDKVFFNRGAMDGAVGLVVDVLRDSRRVIDSLAALADGDNVLPEGSGAESLLKMYPFLSEKREQGLLGAYKEKLKGLQGGPAVQREVLERGIAKVEALITKKRQMRFQFMMELRQISDCATAALTVFEQEGFREVLFQRLQEYAPPPSPPEGEAEDNPPEESEK